MNRLTKNLLTAIPLILTSLTFSLSANAAHHTTDNELLNQCKTSVNAQLQNVERVKVAHISSRRGLFKAKLRVTADGNRSMVLCEISDGSPVALTCLKGASCSVDSIASAGDD